MRSEKNVFTSVNYVFNNGSYKAMKDKYDIHLKVKLKLLTALLVFMQIFFCPSEKPLLAQGVGEPGIQFIMVSFDQPPSNVTVQKAPLRYNKKFALSFHTDDGIADVFTVGFPFFTGINTTGTNHPGLFYTDGCGNDISFKLSSALFSWSRFNNEDMHQPGNGYGTVSWPQLELMYQNGCGIYNHGFTSDAFTDLPFMRYSIQRNESFIRRRLQNTISGGVRTRVFVNPNGATNYTPVAFNEGYRATFRMGASDVIPNDGVNVNAFSNWGGNLELNRQLAESVNVQQLANQLATASNDGANMWMPVFTHRIIEDYPQNSFISDFNYIASTYGKNGQDNIWMTTEEEILNYLHVRDATTVSHIVSGTTMLITFSGQIPTDMRYYPLSLVIQAENANITVINIVGGTNNTHSGTGQNNALINLSWDGKASVNLFELAESHVVVAEQSPTEYNGLVAMDYVFMLPEGPQREGLKNRLCALTGINYDPGFCTSCDFDLGMDITICSGTCVTLEAPDEPGSTYLWSSGQTTSSITVCPATTTTYSVAMTTSDGCEASDTLVVTVLPALVFDLGSDLSVCQGETILINGPASSGYTYEWFANGQQLPETSSSLNFVLNETSVIRLDVTTENGCVGSDSLTATALPSPVFDLGSDRTGCLGEAILIEGPVSAVYSYQWFANGEPLSVTTSFLQLNLTDTVMIRLEVTNFNGCFASDSLWVYVWDSPEVSVTPESVSLCEGSAAINLTASAMFAESLLWWNGVTLTENQFVPDTPGVYELWVKAFNGFGCTSSDTSFITVFEKPVITLQIADGTSTICAGDTIRLIVSAVGDASLLKVVWNDTDTIPMNGQSSVFRDFILSQSATIKATGITAEGCSDSKTISITVASPPIISVSPDTDICLGDSYTLQAEGGLQCVWYQNGIQIASGYITTVSPSETTTYVAVVSGGSPTFCTASKSVTITVRPIPNVDITASSVLVCSGAAVTLTASGASSYLWSGGQTGSQIVVNPVQTTLFEVTGTSIYGCTANDTLTIKVNPSPGVSFTGLLPVYCQNDPPASLTGIPEGGFFSGPGIEAFRFEPPTAGPGFHDIVYHFTNEFDCTGRDTITTRVLAFNLTIDIGQDTSICPNDSITLDAGEGFANYFWSTGQLTQQIVIHGSSFLPGTSREIQVAGVLNGCTASGSMSLTIRDDCFIGLNENENLTFFTVTPNPNSGSFSLIWHRSSDNISMALYNLQGSKIWHLENFAINSKGESTQIDLLKVAEGVYFLIVYENQRQFTAKIVIG
jgi:hypothetical protein